MNISKLSMDKLISIVQLHVIPEKLYKLGLKNFFSPLICFNSLKQLGAAAPVLSFFDVILKQNHEKKLTAAFFFDYQ